MIKLLKYVYLSKKYSVIYLLIISICLLIINLAGNQIPNSILQKGLWFALFMMYIYVILWMNISLESVVAGKGNELTMHIPELGEKIIFANLILVFTLSVLLLVNVTSFFMVSAYFFPHGLSVASVSNVVEIALYASAFFAIVNLLFYSVKSFISSKWVTLPIAAIAFVVFIWEYVGLLMSELGNVQLVANRFIEGEPLGYSQIFLQPLSASLRNIIFALMIIVIATYISGYIAEKHYDMA